MCFKLVQRILFGSQLAQGHLAADMLSSFKCLVKGYHGYHFDIQISKHFDVQKKRPERARYLFSIEALHYCIRNLNIQAFTNPQHDDTMDWRKLGYLNF